MHTKRFAQEAPTVNNTNVINSRMDTYLFYNHIMKCQMMTKMYYLPHTTPSVMFLRVLSQALCFSFISMTSAFICAFRTYKYIAPAQSVPDQNSTVCGHRCSDVLQTSQSQHILNSSPHFLNLLLLQEGACLSNGTSIHPGNLLLMSPKI